MKLIKAQGFIIRRVNTGEADRLITIFTQNHGKLRLKAKGVRKISSRRGGSLELFNRVKFAAAHEVLTEIEVINTYSAFRNDLTRIGLCYHFIELVDRFLPEHLENNSIFDLLNKSFTELCQPSTSLTELNKQFEVTLLSALGFGLPHEKTQRNLIAHIEGILEKPLRSRQFLLKLSA